MIKSQVSQESVRKDKQYNIKNAVAINIQNLGSVNATFLGRPILASKTLVLNFGATTLNTEDIEVLFDKTSPNYNNVAEQHLHIIATKATSNCSCG